MTIAVFVELVGVLVFAALVAALFVATLRDVRTQLAAREQVIPAAPGDHEV